MLFRLHMSLQEAVLNLKNQEQVKLIEVRNLTSKQLSSILNINYKPDSSREADVLIGPVAALSPDGMPQLGVYANHEIKVIKGKKKRNQKLYLGKYIGENKPDNPRNDSQYCFVLDGRDQFDPTIQKTTQGRLVDAEQLGNWSRYINFSLKPNCLAVQEENEIVIYAKTNIKKNEQLLLDYGEEFRHINFKARNKFVYLHKTCNWKIPDTIYQENKKAYFTTILQLSSELIEALSLASPYFLVTELAYAVITQSISAVKKTLAQQSSIVDLESFSLERTGFNQFSLFAFDQQQNLTPLMLACYLGNEEIIRLLLNYGADVNRCGLYSGDAALHLLLKGKAQEEIKANIVKLLINKGGDINFPNEKNLTPCHWIVQQKNSVIKNYRINVQLFTESKVTSTIMPYDSSIPSTQKVSSMSTEKYIKVSKEKENPLINYVRKQCQAFIDRHHSDPELGADFFAKLLSVHFLKKNEFSPLKAKLNQTNEAGVPIYILKLTPPTMIMDENEKDEKLAAKTLDYSLSNSKFFVFKNNSNHLFFKKFAEELPFKLETSGDAPHTLYIWGDGLVFLLRKNFDPPLQTVFSETPIDERSDQPSGNQVPDAPTEEPRSFLGNVPANSYGDSTEEELSISEESDEEIKALKKRSCELADQIGQKKQKINQLSAQLAGIKKEKLKKEIEQRERQLDELNKEEKSKEKKISKYIRLTNWRQSASVTSGNVSENEKDSTVSDSIIKCK